MEPLAWHYTIGKYIDPIREAGALLPTTDSALPGERAVIWFSRMDRFEPTARKARWENGVLRVLSVQETFDAGGGLYRYAVPARLLMPWPEIVRAACISKDHRRRLEKVGYKQGATPSLWMGAVHPIPLEQVLAIEPLDRDGRPRASASAGGARG